MLFIVDVYSKDLLKVDLIQVQHGSESSARQDDYWVRRETLPAGTEVIITRFDDGDEAERAHGIVIARYPHE